MNGRQAFCVAASRQTAANNRPFEEQVNRPFEEQINRPFEEQVTGFLPKAATIVPAAKNSRELQSMPRALQTHGNAVSAAVQRCFAGLVKMLKIGGVRLCRTLIRWKLTGPPLPP